MELRPDVPALTSFLSALPVSHVKLMVTSLTDYAKTVQQEQTKRMRIEAQERKALESIRECRDFWKTYLRYAFIERQEVFEKLFVFLDRAVESRDPAIVMATANLIADIARTSPLAALDGKRPGTTARF